LYGAAQVAQLYQLAAVNLGYQSGARIVAAGADGPESPQAPYLATLHVGDDEPEVLVPVLEAMVLVESVVIGVASALTARRTVTRA
jgi:hypothetical protein